MNFLSLEIDKLKPYPKNARMHSKAQIERIANSIKEFGFTLPILVNQDFMILAGHGRLEAAKTLHMTHVPVIQHQHLTEVQQQAYILADNRLAELSKWDKDLLGEELTLLKDVDFDLKLTGFENFKFDIEMQEADEDIPTNYVKRCVKGDIWQLDEHRLMCGDSLNIHDVQKLIEGHTIEFVYNDPPYGISIVGDNGGVGGGTQGKYKPIKGDDSIDTAIECFNLCATLNIKAQLFWGANHYAQHLPNSPCWIVWDKQDGKHVTFADCELAWTSFDKPARVFTHVWDGFRRASEKGDERFHPTQKPVALAEEIFGFFEVGKTVLDLFGGSGSTLIAAEKTKRTCFIMEMDEQYCDKILARWEKYTGKIAERI